MTVHIAVATAPLIVVVGDKLLTTRMPAGEYRRWEEHSNKTIVVRARNAHVVISYAGLAHIRDKPTDEWLVDTITKRDAGPQHRGHRSLAQFGPPMPDLTLGAIRQRIVEAIRADFLTLADRLQAYRIEVMIAGWTWKRLRPSKRERIKGVRYLITGESVASDPAGFDSWPTVIAAPATGPTWQASIIGSFDGDLICLRGLWTGGTISHDDIRRAIVADVRRQASRPNTTVGHECVSVQIPWDGLPVVTFERAPGATPSGATYWPFVVSWHGTIHAPAVASCAHGQAIVSGIEFRVEPPCAPGTAMRMSGQTRRRVR